MYWGENDDRSTLQDSWVAAAIGATILLAVCRTDFSWLALASILAASVLAAVFIGGFLQDRWDQGTRLSRFFIGTGTTFVCAVPVLVTLATIVAFLFCLGLAYVMAVVYLAPALIPICIIGFLRHEAEAVGAELHHEFRFFEGTESSRLLHFTDRYFRRFSRNIKDTK